MKFQISGKFRHRHLDIDEIQGYLRISDILISMELQIFGKFRHLDIEKIQDI